MKSNILHIMNCFLSESRIVFINFTLCFEYTVRLNLSPIEMYLLRLFRSETRLQ